MKVIRHGKLWHPFPIRIGCPCGCLYEAEEEDGEFSYSATSGNAKNFRVKCPECGEEYKTRIIID